MLRPRPAMEPDATLAWILRLRDDLDAALESGLAPDADAVYALVGLLDELDRWLAEGRSPPARWRRAFAAATALAPVVLRGRAASNDPPGPTATAMTTAPGARRSRARRAANAAAQLALPWAGARR